MKIFFDPDSFVPMFALDQLLQNGEIRDVYQHFGLHGVHFSILYGWMGSPFQGEKDEDARASAVYHEAYSKPLFDMNKKKMTLGHKDTKKYDGMHTNHFIKKAIKEINTYAKVPDFEMAKFYETELALLQGQISITYDKNNFADNKKKADFQKVALGNIDTIKKSLDACLERIQSRMKIQKVASLNDFILNAEGNLGVDEDEEMQTIEEISDEETA